MATIKDVAKQAGVSVTTVSIIINGKAEERKISAATQERVAEAMRDLGYQPNLSIFLAIGLSCFHSGFFLKFHSD